MPILVTGGAGYIGSHTVIELIQSGEEVVIVDNLSNASRESLDRIREITGVEPKFYEGDIRNQSYLEFIFFAHNIESVIHFAGLKAVGESVKEPLKYYENNVAGTISLCNAMANAKVNRLIFSSSATVYGDSDIMPLHEGLPTGIPSNPYGQTKLMVETVLNDLAMANPDLSLGLLRYFNPIGAHPSGLIGEDPLGIPNNLVPFVVRVATGVYPQVMVFGSDYPTKDGTGIRDYIHVMDLAKGHVKCLKYLKSRTGVHTFNLGTGQGYSVLDVIETFREVSGKSIPIQMTDRREGDVAECWAETQKAKRVLGWEAELGIQEMIEDTWRWQRNCGCNSG